MARHCACRSPRRNPPPTDKDELAKAVSIDGSATPTPTPIVSRAPTLHSAIEIAETRTRNSL